MAKREPGDCWWTQAQGYAALVVLILIGSIALFASADTIRDRERAARRAVPIPARVLEGGPNAIQTRWHERSFLRRDREYGEPFVLYEYEWNGQWATSRGFTLGTTSMYVIEAMGMARRFPAGKQITVLMLPDGKTTLLGRYQSPFLFGMIMVLAALIMTESLYRTRKDRRGRRPTPSPAQVRGHAIARAIALLLHGLPGVAYVLLTDWALQAWWFTGVWALGVVGYTIWLISVVKVWRRGGAPGDAAASNPSTLPDDPTSPASGMSQPAP